jgi:hypothetical protein
MIAEITAIFLSTTRVPLALPSADLGYALWDVPDTLILPTLQVELESIVDW